MCYSPGFIIDIVRFGKIVIMFSGLVCVCQQKNAQVHCQDKHQVSVRMLLLPFLILFKCIISPSLLFTGVRRPRATPPGSSLHQQSKAESRPALHTQGSYLLSEWPICLGLKASAVDLHIAQQSKATTCQACQRDKERNAPASW